MTGASGTPGLAQNGFGIDRFTLSVRATDSNAMIAFIGGGACRRDLPGGRVAQWERLSYVPHRPRSPR
ncbi:hypothetical protein SAMN06295900_108183 [Trinickia caryophylli]|uniref:Uncharacterized protein n=1 Tax=Trinickia caryophylli TaxID=28094 RepID=A0A1X7FC03_TRICW|nr:hypothetical protein SAMN06295900_108183 [Trinickia caryophylli]